MPGCEDAKDECPAGCQSCVMHDVFEIFCKIIDEGHDFIGIGHRQLTARAKIILYVDNKKHFVFTGLHGNLFGQGKRRIP